jgi:TetR/AcrR family transcriptional regulator of autoinduction and epiphytic fitness
MPADTPVPSRSAEAVDGRLTRTVRSRLAICEACLDLVQEGVLQPSADQIAERAGLSRRSVFNHFGDLAELYDSVVEVGMQRCAPLLKEISRDEPVARRLAQFTDARSNFLEATAPFTRALTAQSLVGPAGPQARRVSQTALQQQQESVARLFEAEIDSVPDPEQQPLVEALSSAASAHTWEYLRRGRGLSLSRARDITLRTMSALLRDAGVEIS